MAINYTPVRRHQIESRMKRGVPVNVQLAMVRLVSAAISGMIRHVVGITLDNRSAETQCSIVVCDASGLSTTVDTVELGASLLSNQGESKVYEEWHPAKAKVPYLDLQAGETLWAVNSVSGICYANALFWDE
jgi:hypothetical protein